MGVESKLFKNIFCIIPIDTTHGGLKYPFRVLIDHFGALTWSLLPFHTLVGMVRGGLRSDGYVEVICHVLIVSW